MAGGKGRKRRRPSGALLATLVSLLMLSACTGEAAGGVLQNDSYVSGTFTCVGGWDDLESRAAGFAAPPADYPIRIEAVQLLTCGTVSDDAIGIDLFGDSLDADAVPEPLGPISTSGAYMPFAGMNEIDLSTEDIVVAGGGMRVSAVAANGDMTLGLGADPAFTPMRNFTLSSAGTWKFAENDGVSGDFVIRALYTASRTLTVSPAGGGSGVVSSAPAGIDCGATCSGRFYEDTQVTLGADPDPGSKFGGWSGAGCSGTGTCQVTPADDLAVTATFDEAVPPVTTITDKPKAKVRTKKRKVNVSFAFEANEPASNFECKLDDRDPADCDSPESFEVKRGKHTFEVSATDLAANVGDTASYEFKVVRRG